MLPRHTQPEKDVQAMLNQLQITLISQPRPASSRLNRRSETLWPYQFCGGDLCLAYTESKEVSCCETLELRKFG
jgi:hypothetical protein